MAASMCHQGFLEIIEARYALFKHCILIVSMKKTSLFFLLLGVSLATWANPIDVETARSIAEKFFVSASSEACASDRVHRSVTRVEMQLVCEPTMTTRATHEAAEYYVFAPADSIGFVIVAGDDEVKPIVGYSHSSKFSSQDIPPALAKYLAAYVQYIRLVWDGSSEPRMQSEEQIVPVFPFIKTTWNQGYPYNMYCPTINGKSTFTGCVATAVAQIMKYYEWPKRGHGSCTATLNDGYNTTVSTSLTKEYDWDSMIDNYYPSGSYTKAEANAVAQLMMDAGYACRVHYGTDATSAYTYDAVTALLRHFDYSPKIRFIDRSYYSDAAWNDLIYQELLAGRPVWYRGADIDGKEGHAFICSGVDQDCRYYINWGWGSWCDGYFDLGAVVPDGYDYNYYQQAIINIQPKSEEECVEDYKPIPHVGQLEITEQDNSLVTPQVTYTIYVTNTTDRTISGQTGYAMFMDGVMVTDNIYELITYIDLKPDWYWWYSGEWFRWDDATGMSPGLREIRFFWRPIDDTEWYEPYGEHSIYMLTTENGHYFSTDKGEFVDSDVDGIEGTQANALRIEPFKGGVRLTSPEAVKVGIYTMNGMLMREVELMPGRMHTCTLPQGIYLLDGTKMVVY